MKYRPSLFVAPLVVGAGALLVPHALAADLHVGSGQTYSTVQDAVDAAAAGDVIHVHAGDYQEDVDMNADGTDTARITMQPAGDGQATITGRITMEGDHWDIVDLTFVARAGARAFRVRGDHNRLIGLEISDGEQDGINGSGIGNEVRSCTIHNFDAGQSDAHCIVLNPGVEDWVIADSELYDCSGDTIQLYADGAERTIINTRIENNDMYFTGALSRTENAIDVKNADGLIIFGNRMHGFPSDKTVVVQKGPANIDMQCNVMFNGDRAIEFRAEDGGTVENIIFSRNLVYGFSSYGLKFDGTVGAEVFNNTFVDLGGWGLRTEGGGLDNGTVRNNLWSNTGSVESGNFTADHNGFWQVGSNDIPSGSDVEADPLLDGEYKLGSGSPMIDVGVDVGLPFAGAAPDIGWDETTMDSCGETGAGGSASGSSGTGGGSSSSSGTGGGSSSSSGTGGGSASGSSGGWSGSEDDGGCGCRQVGSAPRQSWAWLAALLGMGVALGRRRAVGG